MMPGELLTILVESPSSERFEAEVPPDTRVAKLAADFFESQGWPVTDRTGRGQRAVVELVDPENPDRTKRLNGEFTLSEAGISSGRILRIFPESVAGGRSYTGSEDIFANTYNVITEDMIQSAVEKALQQADFKRVFHPIFCGSGFRVEDDLCFVLMPFGPEDLQIVYQDHVCNALKQCKLRVQRADDIYGTGSIIEDIWAGINRARLIVADLTGRNPNVLYEVGICHTLGKNVIMLAQTADDIPFDLRHLRSIIYNYTPRGCKRLEEILAATVEKLLTV